MNTETHPNPDLQSYNEPLDLESGCVASCSYCVCRCSTKPVSSAAYVTKAWTPLLLHSTKIIFIAKVSLTDAAWSHMDCLVAVSSF